MNYINPFRVIDCVYDENDIKVDIGLQRDVVEYLTIFIEQVDLGLTLIGRLKKTKDKMKEISVEEKDVKSELANLFKGKIMAGLNESFNQEEYGPLIVDANTHNLIEALKEKFEYRIQTDKGELIKNEWIKEASDVMVIQLNTVKFNHKTKQSYKTEHVPEFKDELFIDQFLYDNRKDIEKKKNQIKILDNRIKEFDIKINEEIDKDNNKSRRLSEVNKYHSQQFSKDDKQKVDSFITTNDPGTKEEETFEDLIETRGCLEETKKELMKNMKKTKYNLKAIIIHDGDHTQGHYFVYIKVKDDWVCFNDISIKVVTEKIMLNDCYGKNFYNRNAYCFIYQLSTIKEVDFSKVKLTKELLTYVEKQNEKLDEAMVSIPLNNIIGNIMGRMEDLNKAKTIGKLQDIVPRFTSFELFLFDYEKMKSQNPKDNPPLLNAVILERFLKRVKLPKEQNKIVTLENLSSYPDIKKKIEEQLKILNYPFPELNDKIISLIQTERKVYINTTKALRILGTAPQFLLTNKLQDYIETMHFFFKIQPFERRNFNLIHFDIFKENILYLILIALSVKKIKNAVFDFEGFSAIIKKALYTIYLFNEFYKDKKSMSENHIICLTNELEESYPEFKDKKDLLVYFSLLKGTCSSEEISKIDSETSFDHISVV